MWVSNRAMHPGPRRALLEAVADGTLAPEAAAALLGDPHRDGAERHTRRSTRAEETDAGVGRVRVKGVGAAITIVGDPDVATIDVVGDHQLWNEGTTLVIRVDDAALERSRDGGRRSRPRTRRRNSAPGTHQGPRATIRMNPELTLRLVAYLSAVEITSMTGAVDAKLNMGLLTLREVDAPFDASVRGGRLKVSGRLVSGSSTIRTSMSKVDVMLDPRSDVTVSAAMERGSLVLHDPEGRPTTTQLVVGSGSAGLDLRGRMGAITVGVADNNRAPRS